MTILSPRSREGDPTGHGQGLDLGRLGVTKPGSTPLEGALLEVNEAILRGLPLRELLVLIARKARSVIGASLVAICTPAADGSGQAVRTAIGLGARRLRGWTIPAGDGDAGTLRLGRQPRIVVLDAGPGLRCLPPGWPGTWDRL